MAKQDKNVPLNARDVKFNVKATPVVREARAAMLKAIVSAKGREADLDGLQDTLEVLAEFLEARRERDVQNRKDRVEARVAAQKEAQRLLDNQREETAKAAVASAGKGLKAAKEQLAAIQKRQGKAAKKAKVAE
jgi:hypothetical protein